MVGTPGRVLDHPLSPKDALDPSAIRDPLVLDEADEMLSMGFARELNAILETLRRTAKVCFFQRHLSPSIERLAANPACATPSSSPSRATKSAPFEIGHYVYVLREGDNESANSCESSTVEDPESAIHLLQYARRNAARRRERFEDRRGFRCRLAQRRAAAERPPNAS